VWVLGLVAGVHVGFKILLYIYISFTNYIYICYVCIYAINLRVDPGNGGWCACCVGVSFVYIYIICY